jgi:hypothetical protein
MGCELVQNMTPFLLPCCLIALGGNTGLQRHAGPFWTGRQLTIDVTRNGYYVFVATKKSMTAFLDNINICWGIGN